MNESDFRPNQADVSTGAASIIMAFHVTTQVILAVSVTLYLEHLRNHFLFILNGQLTLPTLADAVIRYRLAFWIVPGLFAVAALILLSRPIVSRTALSVLGAASLFAVVGVVCLAFLATLTPFLIPIIPLSG